MTIIIRLLLPRTFQLLPLSLGEPSRLDVVIDSSSIASGFRHCSRGIWQTTEQHPKPYKIRLLEEAQTLRKNQLEGTRFSFFKLKLLDRTLSITTKSLWIQSPIKAVDQKEVTRNITKFRAFHFCTDYQLHLCFGRQLRHAHSLQSRTKQSRGCIYDFSIFHQIIDPLP